MPFFCYNKDDYCDHSENCDGCDVWVKGKGGKEVPSNADRIRAMSNDGMARILYDRPWCNHHCEHTGEDECLDCIARYLQRPAEEDTP